jgi:hypothetical protein
MKKSPKELVFFGNCEGKLGKWAGKIKGNVGRNNP